MEPLRVSLRRSILFILILFFTISIATSELRLRAPSILHSCLNCCAPSDSDSDQSNPPSSNPPPANLPQANPPQPQSPKPPSIELQLLAVQEQPIDDAPTEDKSAGIGMEFAAGQLLIKSDKLAAKGDQGQTDACKGHSVRYKGDTAEKNWKLTADTGLGAGLLCAEYILNGKLIKVGTGDLKKAAIGVQDALEKWNPSAKSDPNTVTIDKCSIDDWKISKPSDPGSVDKIGWQPQVTVPMPLEAIQELISTVVGDQTPTSPLLTANGHVLVKKEFFGKYEIKDENLTDDVLGFFSLVMSYVKADWDFGTSGSPKQLTNIMPRTDFTTIYTQLRGKIQGGILYEVCKELACFKDDGKGITIDTAWCSGTVDGHTPNNKFDTKRFKIDDKNGPLVKDWIQGISDLKAPDALSAAEKESIGALGSHMEKVLDTERLVPIFEFRSLGPKEGILSGKLADFADEVEKEVIRLLKKYAEAPKVQKRKVTRPKGTMVSPINRRADECKLCAKGCPAKPTATVWLSQNSVHIGNANEVGDGKAIRDQAFKDLQALCPDGQNNCDHTDAAGVDGVWVVIKADGGNEMIEATVRFQFSDSQYFSNEERDMMIAMGIAAWQQASAKSCTDAPKLKGREVDCDKEDSLKKRDGNPLGKRDGAAWLSSLHPVSGGAAPDSPCKDGGKICSAPNQLTIILPTSDPTQPNHLNIDVSLHLDQGESTWDKLLCKDIIGGLSAAAELVAPELVPAEVEGEVELETLCDGDDTGNVQRMVKV